MSEIRQYLFTLISAAIIAALAISIIGKKGLIPSVIKLLTGLFLTVYIIYPLAENRLIDISDMLSHIEVESAEITQSGKDLATEAVSDIIKDKVEAYILDKAVSMNCELQVRVFMNDANPPYPDSVIIKGNISPYQKQSLIKIINDDIGIPEGEAAVELKKILEKTVEQIKKYKYAILILLIGFALMMLPTGNVKKDTKEDTNQLSLTEKISLEEKLSVALCEIAGAGNVRVILSVASGEEVVYQTNSNSRYNDNTDDTETDTVLVTDANRNQGGLIRQTNPASYQGALIICQGADNPAVHLMIVDAVSKLTGLGANRISVIKMK